MCESKTTIDARLRRQGDSLPPSPRPRCAALSMPPKPMAAVMAKPRRPGADIRRVSMGVSLPLMGWKFRLPTIAPFAVSVQVVPRWPDRRNSAIRMPLRCALRQGGYLGSGTATT